MKRWLVSLITDTLAVIYARLGCTLVVLGPRDSALVITESGDVSTVLSTESCPESNASRGWTLALNWGFSPEAAGVYDDLIARFNKRFPQADSSVDE